VHLTQNINILNTHYTKIPDNRVEQPILSCSRIPVPLHNESCCYFITRRGVWKARPHLIISLHLSKKFLTLGKTFLKFSIWNL